jgi:two-component system sensor histidine kinase BaeS
MGRLSFRLGATMAVLALAILLGVGLVTTVTLRSLHQSAKEANLVLLSRSLLTQARTDAMQGNLRAAIRDLDSVLSEQGVTPWLLLADGRLHGIDGGPGVAAPADLDQTGARGTGDSGTTAFPDGHRYAWASTLLRPAGAVTGPRAVVFTAPDDSGALALQDIFRGLPLVALLTVLVGGALGWWIHRSVTGPLGRLAHATERVALDGSGGELPLQGPTEVRELTGRFNAMTRELAAARERETALLANLRHDLRTPLTVISGFAAALLDGTAEGAERERAARAIEEEAGRLGALVDQLNDVERLRSGSGLRPESIDVVGLLHETAARFAARAGAVGASIDVLPSEPDEAPVLTADRTAVERMLANLVENALAALRPGGHIWLSWSVDAAGGSGASGPAVTLSVTDDGRGFPPGTTERVFERFVRGDPSRHGPGSGLGLAIVRELARGHGGEAIAENVAPHGARVSVRLPLLA